MANGTAIEIDGLSKRFGKVQAVSDMSFEVDAGRVTGFLGPNGAGKTTTLRMLLGLIHADRGSATFGGRRYEELDASERATSAPCSRTRRFHPGRTGRNHLRVLAAAGRHPESRVTRCSSRSASPPPPTGASRATRWACASGSRSRPRCSATPRC